MLARHGEPRDSNTGACGQGLRARDRSPTVREAAIDASDRLILGDQLDARSMWGGAFVAFVFRLRAKRFGETRRSLGGGGQADDPVAEEADLHKCHNENRHSQENRHEGVRVAREI
jgi:hypothetical protein